MKKVNKNQNAAYGSSDAFSTRPFAGRYGDKHMKSLILAILLLSLGIGSANSIEISNFKSGLFCTDLETFGWVCHETEQIYVTGQSKCIYDNGSIPCTWHGFEFDYKNHKEGDIISCKLESSRIFSLGNPEGVLSNDTTSDEYELEIPYGSGHFYNPQYVGLSVVTTSEDIEKQDTVCYSNDKEIFRYTKQFVYPKNP